ncbi:hypothetical protein E2C01_098503 [Portunus trituberculatus]|uniref:Uncharacterized protein n=1 Tax=Portunus trituberculatus TaxID=210409 RepID=A0A5B7K8F4_PORTR|nr:hypothetical protein [Portunus trituberculatus]
MSVHIPTQAARAHLRTRSHPHVHGGPGCHTPGTCRGWGEQRRLNTGGAHMPGGVILHEANCVWLR